LIKIRISIALFVKEAIFSKIYQNVKGETPEINREKTVGRKSWLANFRSAARFS
jgi:hypothetical protein